MLMRVTKIKDDDFTLQFSNTGAGLDENPDFHPRESFGSGNYQVTAEIQHITSEKLQGDFFERCSKLMMSNNKNSVDSLIMQIYEEMKTLGSPIKYPVKDSPYWSRQQLGGSCVPSSVWAMAKMVLNKDEIKKLETDMRLKSLIANYKMIKNGWDQSSTAKIMVLDQIQTLKNDFKQKVDIFDTIEEELLGKLNMSSPEMKIAGNKGLPSLIKSKSNGEVVLKAKKANLRAAETKLTARLSFENVEPAAALEFKAVQNPEKPSNYQGKNLCDKYYLLYLAIACGDHKDSTLFLQDAMKCMEECVQLFLNKEESKLQSLLGPKETVLKMADLLDDLASQLGKIDKTRSGMAKGFVLAEMAAFIKTILHEKYVGGSLLINLLNFYQEYGMLKVKAHLPLDNVWVLALERLQKATEVLQHA